MPPITIRTIHLGAGRLAGSIASWAAIAALVIGATGAPCCATASSCACPHDAAPEASRDRGCCGTASATTGLQHLTRSPTPAGRAADSPVRVCSCRSTTPPVTHDAEAPAATTPSETPLVLSGTRVVRLTTAPRVARVRETHSPPPARAPPACHTS